MKVPEDTIVEIVEVAQPCEEVKRQGSGWSAHAYCPLSKVACPRGSKIGNQKRTQNTETAFHRRLARVEAKLDTAYRSQFVW